MTNTPLAGWYPDPEIPTQVRYWDGEQWTEHVAAIATAAPAYPATPHAPLSMPQSQHITLFNNPYEKPPRVSRREREDALSGKQRAQAAAIDAVMVIPFIVLGFGLPHALAWVSGNSAAQDHAYHAAALVLAIVLGVGVVFWNFVMREITVGTAWVSERDGDPNA